MKYALVLFVLTGTRKVLRKKGRQREEGVWVKVGARSEEGVVNDMALYKGNENENENT